MLTLGTVTLPSPQFEDVRKVKLNNLINTTAKGNSSIYKAASWPVITTFLYRFLIKDCSGSTTTIIEELKQFLADNAGLVVSWTDHNSVTRDGYVITEEPEFISIGDDYYELTLEIMEDLE